MSNLSSIGFNLNTEADLQPLIENTYANSVIVAASNGNYHVYTDPSNAQIWLQFDKQNNWLGLNPHYRGKSRRLVELTTTMSNSEYPMEGAFHGWAVEEHEGATQQIYPFVFEAPDYTAISQISFPSVVTIQLTAFATEMSLYDSPAAFENAQDTELKMAAISFIPSGLFSSGEKEEAASPEAFGFFAGIIKEWEKKRNEMTGAYFYWLLVDTLGGSVDIVADERFFERQPVIEGVVQGNFWLSAQILSTKYFDELEAAPAKEKKGFFNRLFGK